ncbi:MAG: GNAT family N-acetyltransferase [Burkholderiaceae bacterium]|nr:GNAT family N-acetyltransferase [Burkholderiaceae bacterium]MCD8515796.1 GNAT family N-acetyltransferase [Burkholderiaceae bacterium]MCD8565394.1 GNAT family N-acetyltransferase [Burkholderiaceae bacterium]
MNNIRFADGHSPEWSLAALEMTRDYFLWMNAEIERVCRFSISDVVGMPLHEYIASTGTGICPRDQTGARYYLVVDGEQALGMGGLRTLPNGDAELVRIYTKPEFRGRGIASMTIKQLIADARQSQFEKLKLDTGVFMKAAHSVYASHGFSVCHPYEGAEPPERLRPFWIFMELDLLKTKSNPD